MSLVFESPFVWILCIPALYVLLGVRYIPHNKVGIVEKLWSFKGSLSEGRIIALNGEAGFQCSLLRGGVHFGLFPWQYRIHRQPLVTVSEGKIGYVYARDGAPLPPTQTLADIPKSNHFQDAVAFLSKGGQRGRQRAILREGVYAVNLSLFVVITEDRVYSGPGLQREDNKYAAWQTELASQRGFSPVLIGAARSVSNGEDFPPPALKTDAEAQADLLRTDTLGVVTVHDGPPIPSGEIIAPEVKTSDTTADHNYFQDPQVFLALGGRRGKQLQVLTDGTFYINRWFATVEEKPKTIIPIGYVGVVVAYYGSQGMDTTGTAFRYGEQVEHGNRGVWRRGLPPGKYALNPYALKIELVPTVNFVLRWITGQVEAHRYDADLESIELITADGYEPVLPLSLVLHIDYEKASSVVQRFGDVKRLISQTLDPILTAYFRDVAQSSHMLDLLTKREEIQRRGTEELGRRFSTYDITCVAVLIGRPESKEGQTSIETLFDQLRLRRLAEEQKETFGKQQEAARQLQDLNEAQAAAAKQTELTQTKIEVEVSANKGEAQLAEAQRLAKRDIVRAEGESRSRELLGAGEAAKISQIGRAEASVNLQKIRAYGDPRLFALNLVSEHFAQSTQPLVPERMFMFGGVGGGDGQPPAAGNPTLVNQLLALLIDAKSGLNVSQENPAAEPAGTES
ncbi:MAG TPA: SPFH domain-containing protein [Chthoniobacterales bacterium]